MCLEALRKLRRAFVDAAKERLGMDHSGMDDESQAGKFYLDSLAVLPSYRRRGIPGLCSQLPRNALINFACRASDFWLTLTMPVARLSTLLSASDMQERTDGENIPRST